MQHNCPEQLLRRKQTIWVVAGWWCGTRRSTYFFKDGRSDSLIDMPRVMNLQNGQWKKRRRKRRREREGCRRHTWVVKRWMRWSKEGTQCSPRVTGRKISCSGTTRHAGKQCEESVQKSFSDCLSSPCDREKKLSSKSEDGRNNARCLKRGKM